MNDIVQNDLDRWQRFLHIASYIREVGAACSQGELRLLRALTKYNHGRTILPTLRGLAWRHAVPTDTSILLLSSPSLRDLEVTISRLGTESTGGKAFATPQRFEDFNIVDPVFVGLVKAAPSLRRFAVTGRQGPGPDLITHLLGLTRLRELFIYNQSCILDSQSVRAILENMSSLELLFARIVDFADPGPSVYAPGMRDLRLHGASPDILGALSPGFLDLPHLQNLSLRASEDEYSPHSIGIFSLVASAPFSRSLRKLTVHLINDKAEFLWLDMDGSSAFAAVIRPLFALQDLEEVDICLANNIYPFRDEDVLEIARAWKHLRSLFLSYAPLLSYPPLTSLHHFSEHCPELQVLSMTKLSIPETIEVATAPRKTAHTLCSLDLKLTFSQNADVSGRLEKAMIARYIDYLFPNLVLCDPHTGAQTGLPAVRYRLPGFLNWSEIEQEIREIRTQRLA